MINKPTTPEEARALALELHAVEVMPAYGAICGSAADMLEALAAENERLKKPKRARRHGLNTGRCRCGASISFNEECCGSGDCGYG